MPSKSPAVKTVTAPLSTCVDIAQAATLGGSNEHRPPRWPPRRVFARFLKNAHRRPTLGCRERMKAFPSCRACKRRCLRRLQNHPVSSISRSSFPRVRIREACEEARSSPRCSPAFMILLSAEAGAARVSVGISIPLSILNPPPSCRSGRDINSQYARRTRALASASALVATRPVKAKAPAQASVCKKGVNPREFWTARSKDGARPRFVSTLCSASVGPEFVLQGGARAACFTFHRR